MHVDLAFRLQEGGLIPSDHGYPLFAAVSHLIPEVHQENSLALHPISGRQAGERRLMLMPWSTLAIRTTDQQIGGLLTLAGKSLRIDNATLQVGVPEVRALTPATAVRSRLVVIKIAHSTAADLTAEGFAAAARRQMDELGVGSEAILTVGKRRTLRLKQRQIVGYELIVEGLTANESIALQERGIGGKRHLGCGVFASLSEKTA